MFLALSPNEVTLLVLTIVFGVVAIACGVLLVVFRIRDKKAKKSADDIIKEAKSKAEHLVKAAKLDAQQMAFEIRQQAETEARTRRAEVAAEEQRLSIRADAFEARETALLERERGLEERKNRLDEAIETYKKRQADLEARIDDILRELEKVAGMSSQEAHDEIMRRVESKMAMEIAAYIKNAEDEARDTAQARAIDLDRKSVV